MAPPLPPLRSKLLLLAAVGVIPGLILSLVLGYFLIDHEKETFRQAAVDRNRTFVSAVDAQMRGYLGTLTKPVAPKFLHDVMNALTSKGRVKG